MQDATIESKKIDPKDLEVTPIVWRPYQVLNLKDFGYFLVHAVNRKGTRVTLKTLSKADYESRGGK